MSYLHRDNLRSEDKRRRKTTTEKKHPHLDHKHKASNYKMLYYGDDGSIFLFFKDDEDLMRLGILNLSPKMSDEPTNFMAI